MLSVGGQVGGLESRGSTQSDDWVLVALALLIEEHGKSAAKERLHRTISSNAATLNPCFRKIAKLPNAQKDALAEIGLGHALPGDIGLGSALHSDLEQQVNALRAFVFNLVHLCRTQVYRLPHDGV